jgi:hypothetical protein
VFAEVKLDRRERSERKGVKRRTGSHEIRGQARKVKFYVKLVILSLL